MQCDNLFSTCCEPWVKTVHPLQVHCSLTTCINKHLERIFKNFLWHVNMMEIAIDIKLILIIKYSTVYNSPFDLVLSQYISAVKMPGTMSQNYFLLVPYDLHIVFELRIYDFCSLQSRMDYFRSQMGDFRCRMD